MNRDIELIIGALLGFIAGTLWTISKTLKEILTLTN